MDALSIIRGYGCSDSEDEDFRGFDGISDYFPGAQFWAKEEQVAGRGFRSYGDGRLTVEQDAGPTFRNHERSAAEHAAGPSFRSYEGSAVEQVVGPSFRNHDSSAVKQFAGPSFRNHDSSAVKQFAGPSFRNHERLAVEDLISDDDDDDVSSIPGKRTKKQIKKFDSAKKRHSKHFVIPDN
ncbi:hypothetical protein pipiens_005807, partial [Culex pipiens pipiens]